MAIVWLRIMRKLFPGSYPHKKEDFDKMWVEGMFVFDTNMLLNFHRYSEGTRKEFLDLVSAPEVAPRIWIPYQVAAEYHRHLDEVRHEQVAACIKIKHTIEEWSRSSRAGDHKKRAEELLTVAKKLVKETEDQYSHPEGEALIEQIADLFDGKVGPEWDQTKLKPVYKDGEERYKSKIPPGFKDTKKAGDDQYGDLVIWFQIIEEATKRQKPVIFVTDDVKEDWWLRINGKTIGPLPALRDEIQRKAGVSFHMYEGDRFLEQARTSLRREVAEATVKEVKQVRVEQEKHDADFEKVMERTVRDLDFQIAIQNAARQLGWETDHRATRFALNHPDDFWYRTGEKVGISIGNHLSKMSAQDLNKILNILEAVKGSVDGSSTSSKTQFGNLSLGPAAADPPKPSPPVDPPARNTGKLPKK